MKMIKYKTVDEYINSFEEETKALLITFRKKIQQIAPDSIESMSYGMPGYKLNGKPLVYFAAFKKHIGFFPTPGGINGLDQETKPYRTGKGTMQFKLSEKIPWDLVEKVVKYRIKEINK